MRTPRTHRRKPRGKPVIWWAVDPFEAEAHFDEHGLKVLSRFAMALDAEVRPVTYVDTYLRVGTLSGDTPFGTAAPHDPLETLRETALARLRTLVPPRLRKVLGPPVIFATGGDHGVSRRDMVEAISRAARKDGVILVALHTHARRGLARLYMGSFAETFILYSRVPTLVINPASRPPARLKHILFPTDFSKESLGAFDDTLTLARRLRARVSIAHYEHLPSLSIFLESANSRHQLTDEFQRRTAILARRGANLVRRAEREHVEATFRLLQDAGRDDLPGAIRMLAAKERVSFIAMAASSGKWRCAVVGAASRELARTAPCPLLIYRCRSGPNVSASLSKAGC